METHRRIGFILGPVAFLTILLFGVGAHDPAQRVIAVAAWMLIWWVTEALPIYITAMLPMVFFPALGIMDVKDTFMPYASPIIFLFLGGFIIALAMEERQLHKRIAFSLIRLTGTRPSGIIMGLMAATALVAMWISNTATAVMMLPIAISVVHLLRDQVEDRMFKRLAMVLMLGIAYAANIGGTMTLIGTPPNLVFAGYYLEEMGTEFSFGRWLLIGLPTGLALLIAGYLLLTKVVFRVSGQHIAGAKEVFEQQWKALGRMSRAEQLVLTVFSCTVLVWVTAQPINDFVGQKVLNNTNIAMAGGLLMFMVPVSWKRGEFILNWTSTKRLPWGILILFGGGLSLANGLERAGIIDDIANWVVGSVIADPLYLCIGLTLIALFLTEVMSNVALVTVLLPVVFRIATQMGADPLFLTIPVTLAASCAFMMPISTPPNAVVYSSGHVSVGQMMKAGIWMNFIAVAVIVWLSWLIL